MTTQFDAIIIGAGQGGKPLAYAFADLGWKVAFIERAYLGGTCINTGCTPTKSMIASAQVAHYARDGARWGVQTSGVHVDMPAVIARKRTIVESFRHSIEKKVAKIANIRYVHGQARFTAPHQVHVNGETFESEKIFIDTGGRPSVPKIDGIETAPYLTNETLIDLEEVPEHLIILGGGYIGLEFGQMYRRFGSRVTIIQNKAQILPSEDCDIANELQKAIEAEGVVFRLNTSAKAVSKAGSGISVSVDTRNGTESVIGSHLLVATGRTPNTDGLGLDSACIATDERGFIKVNGRMETSVPGVWALGDVKGGPQFTHISYNDYQLIYGNLIEGKNLTIEHRFLPYAVFTDPQLGRVGITEKEARASGRKFKMGTFPAASVSRAIERGETAGLLKIIVDAETDKVLGASILCSEGGEIVQILGTLIQANAPYTVLKQSVFIHPTMAEGFFGLLDAVRLVE